MAILKKIFILFFLGFLLLSSGVLYAADGITSNPSNGTTPAPSNGTGGVDLVNPISSNTVSELLNKLLDLAVQIGIVVVTMGIIYSGFLYATARGNTTKIKSAHDTFYWTLIGAAIVLGAFAITKVVGDTAAQLFK